MELSAPVQPPHRLSRGLVAAWLSTLDRGSEINGRRNGGGEGGGEGRVVMLEMGAIPFRVLNKTSDRVLGRGGKDDDGASVKWGIK